MKEILRKAMPDFLWQPLQALAKWRSNAPYRMLEKQGWVAARKTDFYSPLPVKEDLLRNRSRWDRPSEMPGVAMNLLAMKELWLSLHQNFSEEYKAVPSYEEVRKLSLGAGFTKADSRTLYYMLRHLKPKRYFEIGSGTSTYYAQLTIEANRKLEGADTEVICVEPYRFQNLHKVPNIRIIKDEVQNVPLKDFDVLEAGDILFIDSSHASKIDSDVNYLMMEVVPRVKPGVYIHIHDIPFPYNFPHPSELYIFKKQWPMYWNEPVLVQSFLQFNDSFKVVLSLPYLDFHDKNLVSETVPERDGAMSYSNAIGSLWLLRVK